MHRQDEVDPVSLDWARYGPYQPPYRGPLAQLSRAEATASYEHWMAARPERWDELRRLLAQDGLALGTSDAEVRELQAWFDDSVEANPAEASRLANRWYAVANDIAVVLGDVLVERAPGLRWELFTRGRKDVGYQSPVVTGFTRVANPRYHADIIRLVAGHGHRLVGGLPVRPDAFVTLLTHAVAQA